MWQDVWRVPKEKNRSIGVKRLICRQVPEHADAHVEARHGARSKTSRVIPREELYGR
jgi:hypothetical protein